MSAQIIPFPTRSPTLDPFAEQFYQYALGQHSRWNEIKGDITEFARPTFLWITWDRWRQRAGLLDIEEPDFVALIHRIVRHNRQHRQ